MTEAVIRPPRQRGRASSEKALIDAAILCFAETGPNDVSVRAIAERAGVNHGLVHHYFGSKAGLVHAVVEHMSKRITEAMGEGRSPGVLADENSEGLLFARAFSRVVVDGAMPTGIDWDFPLVKALAESAQRVGGLDADAARIAAVQALAMIMGWALLEPWLLQALGKTPAEAAEVRLNLPAAALRLANVQVPH